MKNLVAMITGGAKGIGRACAETFLESGHSVSLISRTASELKQTEKELLAKYPGKVFSFCGDISSAPTVKDWFKKTIETLGYPTTLVNNAGIFVNKSVVDQNLEDWEKVIRVNLTGAFLCAQELFRMALSHTGPKSIINMSSLAGIRGTEKFPGLSSYVASKFALVGLTESLAVEGRKFGIRVNCIAPGAVGTEMLKKALPELKAEATPKDIAKLVYFLSAPEQSSVLTGSTLEVFSNAT